jgi:hypothetical protein
MKKNLLLIIIPLLIAACQPKEKSSAPAASTSPSYPYTIKHPDNWDMDTSHANTLVALNAVKAYETNDTVLAKKCFADSIAFNYDGGAFKGTFSQLIKMVTAANVNVKNTKIDMKDWEAVVSKDKSEEWVTLWYVQKWTDLKGVADSVDIVNDMQFKANKIVKLNEYVRRYKMK